MSVLDTYKIDRNGAPATGRALAIQITYEIAYSYTGKVIFQNEFEDDWTFKFSDEELIGLEW